jgi:hypothetical protein
MKEYMRGWLSLGWLTDKDLAAKIKELQARLSAQAGVPIELSKLVQTLLKKGLEVHEQQTSHPQADSAGNPDGAGHHQ